MPTTNINTANDPLDEVMRNPYNATLLTEYQRDWDSRPNATNEELISRAAANKGETLKILMDGYQKAKPQLSPEDMKKAQFGAGLTDTFRTLAQLFQHGQGGSVQQTKGASSTQTTNQRLQHYIDRYNQMLERDNAYERSQMDKAFMISLQGEKDKLSQEQALWDRKDKEAYNIHTANQQAIARANEKNQESAEWYNRLIAGQEDFAIKQNSKVFAPPRISSGGGGTSTTTTNAGGYKFTAAQQWQHDAIEAYEHLVATGVIKPPSKLDANFMPQPTLKTRTDIANYMMGHQNLVSEYKAGKRWEKKENETATQPITTQPMQPAAQPKKPAPSQQRIKQETLKPKSGTNKNKYDF